MCYAYIYFFVSIMFIHLIELCIAEQALPLRRLIRVGIVFHRGFLLYSNPQ